MALTGSLGGAWDDGVIQTMTEMRNDVQGMTYTGADRTNMATDSTVATISTSSPSSPKTGELWIDTSSLTGSPAVRPRVYNGSEWVGHSVYYATSAPSSTTTGLLWYDMTLEILRMYRSATEDLHGVGGWHPVQEGTYQLWTNKSAGTVSANRVVIYDTATERGFLTTTVAKNQRVLGVTLEEASVDESVVVAMVGGGATVNVYCNGATLAVTLGDAIATSATAGEARSVGAMPAGVTDSATVYEQGTPLGAFGIAREASSSDAAIAVTLLGYIGQGCVRRKAATTIAAFADGLANANWDGGWDEVDVADYPPGVGGNDFIDSANHKPIAAVLLSLNASMDHGSGQAASAVTLTLALGKDASTTLQYLNMEETETVSSGLAGFIHSIQASDVFVPTSNGSPYTTMGQKFYWAGTKTATAGTAAVNAAVFRAVGYIR